MVKRAGLKILLPEMVMWVRFPPQLPWRLLLIHRPIGIIELEIWTFRQVGKGTLLITKRYTGSIPVGSTKLAGELRGR